MSKPVPQSVKHQAIAIKETQALTTPLSSEAMPDYDPKDVLTTWIKLAQANSVPVQEGKLQAGDIYNHRTYELLAKRGMVFNFVPLFYFKTWVNSAKIDGMFKQQSVEPCTSANSGLPWTYMDNGVECKREQCFNFFVVAYNDLKKEYDSMKSDDFLDAELAKPMILPFKGGSAKMGKVLLSYFDETNIFRKRGKDAHVYRRVYSVTSEAIKNTKATFQALKLLPTWGTTDKEYYPACQALQDQIASGYTKAVLDVPSDDHEPLTAFQGMTDNLEQVPF